MRLLEPWEAVLLVIALSLALLGILLIAALCQLEVLAPVCWIAFEGSQAASAPARGGGAAAGPRPELRAPLA